MGLGPRAHRGYGYGEESLPQHWWDGRATLAAQTHSHATLHAEGQLNRYLNLNAPEGLDARMVQPICNPGDTEALGMGSALISEMFTHIDAP